MRSPTLSWSVLALFFGLAAAPALAGVFDQPPTGSPKSPGKLLFVERPPVRLRSAEDTQTTRQMAAIPITSGAKIVLPGDWGPQGFIRLIVDRVPRPVRVIEWTEAGIQAELPSLTITEATEAKLVVVRDNKRSFPPIALKLLSSAQPAENAVTQPAPAGTFDDAVPESTRE